MNDEAKSTIDRRKFLTVLGVSGGGALALSGCSTSKVEKLVPYLVQAEDQVPGVSTWYASSCTECSTRMRPACTHPRRPGGEAGGQSRTSGESGAAVFARSGWPPGAVQPGTVKGPMARGPDGQFQEITWDDAIARFSAKLAAAGNKVAAISGAGRGTFSDLLSEWVGALGGQLARYEPFASEPDARGQSPGIRYRSSGRARFRTRQVHRCVRC